MKKTLATLLASGALVMSALPAQAIPITQSGSISTLTVETGDEFSATFRTPSTKARGIIGASTLVGFDSSLGTLDSVLLQLRGTQTLKTFLRYLGDTPSSNGVLAGVNMLDLRFFASGQTVPVVTFPLSSLTATASCAGRPCTDTESISSPLAVDLFGERGSDLYAYFATNAQVLLGLNAFVEANVISGLEIGLFSTRSYALYTLNNIHLDLTYNYTPSVAPPPPPPPGSVPEPATSAMLLLGLGLMFALPRAGRASLAQRMS